MKKLILIAVMILSFSLLFGYEIRRSNAIGQDLGDYHDQDEYYLMQNKTEKQLFGPSGLMWTEQRFVDQNEEMLVRFYPDIPEPSITVYTDGRIQQTSVEDQNHYYRYSDDGKLEQVTTYLDDVFLYTKLYGYDEASNRLISVVTLGEDMNSIRYWGSLGNLAYITVLTDKGGQYFLRLTRDSLIEHTFEPSQIGPPVSITKLSSGSTIVEYGGRIETYNERGLLVEQKTAGSVREYLYNENRDFIEERILNPDGSLKILQYKEGVLSMEEERSNAMTTSKITYREDGSMVKTLFSNGEAYSDITYGPDGTKVLSISYY